MPLFEDWKEIAPGQGGFNARTGKWSRVWQLRVAAAGEVEAEVKRIVGGTQYERTNDGRLKRDPPLADPEFPWLYADNVPQVVGMGSKIPGTDLAYREQFTDHPRLEELVANTYNLYPHWNL